MTDPKPTRVWTIEGEYNNDELSDEARDALLNLASECKVDVSVVPGCEEVTSVIVAVYTGCKLAMTDDGVVIMDYDLHHVARRYEDGRVLCMTHMNNDDSGCTLDKYFRSDNE